MQHQDQRNMNSGSLQSKRRPALLPRGVYLSSDDANALKSRVGDGLLPPPDPFIGEWLMRDSTLLKRSSQEGGNESSVPKKSCVERSSKRWNQSTTKGGTLTDSSDTNRPNDNPQRGATIRVQMAKRIAEPEAECNDGKEDQHDTGDKQTQRREDSVCQ